MLIHNIYSSDAFIKCLFVCMCVTTFRYKLLFVCTMEENTTTSIITKQSIYSSSNVAHTISLLTISALLHVKFAYKCTYINFPVDSQKNTLFFTSFCHQSYFYWFYEQLVLFFFTGICYCHSQKCEKNMSFITSFLILVKYLKYLYWNSWFRSLSVTFSIKLHDLLQYCLSSLTYTIFFNIMYCI